MLASTMVQTEKQIESGSNSASETEASQVPQPLLATVPSRHRAEEAVRQLYECEGMPPPKLIIWLRSPIEGVKGADLLAGVKCHGPTAMSRQLWDLIGENCSPALGISDQLLSSIRSQIWTNAWTMEGREIGHQIDMRLAEPRGIFRQSPHYRIWPFFQPPYRLNRYAYWLNEKHVGDNNTWLAEMAIFPPWAKRQDSDIEDLLFRDVICEYQYDLGGFGPAMKSCLEFFKVEAGNALFRQSDPVWLLTQSSHVRTKSLYEIAKNCDWIWCFEGACILTEHPIVLKHDMDGRLHCEDGPALKYADGTSFYLWHGVQTPQLVIETPELITVQMINDERNSEVRRIMIERYGLARYVVDSGFRRVQTLGAKHRITGLRTGVLWVQKKGVDEPVVYVDLLNSTPEPDGTVKRYMLRVDPAAYNGDAMRYVQAAAASTWRDAEGELIFKDWRDYAPAHES